MAQELEKNTIQKLTVPCFFNGAQSPTVVYLGTPSKDNHPLHFQSTWLSKERGGVIPKEIMDSLAKLKDLAEKNGVPFSELCKYALEAAVSTDSTTPKPISKADFETDK